MPKLFVGEYPGCPARVITEVDPDFGRLHPKFFLSLVDRYYRDYNREDAWTNNPTLVDAWPERDVWVNTPEGQYQLIKFRWYGKLSEELGMMPGEIWLNNWQQIEREYPEGESDVAFHGTVCNGGIPCGAIENP